jgi:hypothetical protein
MHFHTPANSDDSALQGRSATRPVELDHARARPMSTGFSIHYHATLLLVIGRRVMSNETPERGILVKEQLKT